MMNIHILKIIVLNLIRFFHVLVKIRIITILVLPDHNNFDMYLLLSQECRPWCKAIFPCSCQVQPQVATLYIKLNSEFGLSALDFVFCNIVHY